MQAASGTATVPVSTRGLAVAGAAAGFVRPRVVVPGQLASGEDCHEHHLVRPTGLDQSDSPPYRVERSGKPPWYVIRMPGGVRGGNRKGPPYSIRPWAPAGVYPRAARGADPWAGVTR